MAISSELGTVISQEMAFDLISSEEGSDLASELVQASELGTAQPLGEAGGNRYTELDSVIEMERAYALSERKTGVRDYNLPYSPPIGTGTYKAYVASRGGSPILYEIPFSDISMTRVVDQSANCSVSVLSTGPAQWECAELIAGTEPWRDELLIYRDNEIAFAGPIINLDASFDGATIDAQDLFYWMERRFNDQDRVFWGDLALTFKGLFDALMEPDPSPNVEVQVHPTGIRSFKSYKGLDVQRGSDLLNELARTGLDFTTIGRIVHVGGKEVFTSNSDVVAPLLLHDGGVLSATVTKDGNLFATDVAVFSGSAEEDGTTRPEPLVGRSTGSQDYFGLVQSVFTELLIRDLESANANAESRRLAMSPAPLRVQASLAPESAFTFRDLIPGRRVDTRLAQTPIPVNQDMRLGEISISVGVDVEEVSITLIPLGISDLELTSA